jgi:hypothetical protein
VDRELAAAAAILEVTLPEAELGEEDLEEEVVPDPD